MYISFIHILLGLGVSIKSVLILKKMPHGPRMCEELCGEVGGCLYPLYTCVDLTCYLSNHSQVENLQNVHKLKMTKRKAMVSRTTTNHRWVRVITSFKGTQVTVQLGIRNVIGPPEVARSQKAPNIRIPEETFKLKTSSAFIKQTSASKCKLLSMTMSQKYPGLLYLLLEQRQGRCLRRLHFVNIITKTWHSSVKCCEREEGKRHIFTGPCIKDTGDVCLYSVNHDQKLLITTYQQPDVAAKRLKPDLKRKQFLGYIQNIYCFIGKSKYLMCFVNYNEIYRIVLSKDSKDIKMKVLRWYFGHFPGLQSFTTDSTGSVGCIVQKRSAIVVTLDYHRRQIYTNNSVRTDATVVTMVNDYVLMHGRDIKDPFCVCRIKSLQSCKMN